MSVNKKYKDSVFTSLFSDKNKLIELYNAIEETNYSLDTNIEINTSENVLYMDRKNDISFTIDGKFIVLLEHQSTINTNMPLRFLMYIARVYEKMVDNKVIYKNKIIKIPTPEFIVLYNGSANYTDDKILRLSDAFIESGNELELKVRLININYDKAAEILERSQTLKEYSYFIYQVNQYRKQGNTLEKAIELAVHDCIKENVLKDFLEANGSEVVNMIFTEFNLEDAKKVWFEEGKEEGKMEVIVSLLDMLDDQTISDKTGLSLDEIRLLRNNNTNN